MKTSIFIAGASLCAIIAWIVLQPASTKDEPILAKIEPEPINQESIHVAREKSSQEKFHPLNDLFLAIDKIVEVEKNNRDENIFSNEEKLREAITIIDKSIRFLRPERARTNFRMSGVDTIDNYSGSLSQIIAPYNKEDDKKFFRERVTALKFLELTQHLKSDDCLRVLEHLATHIDQDQSEQLQRNAKLDLYELAQSCGRIDRESTSTLAGNLTNEIARNTILLGLKRINDD